MYFTRKRALHVVGGAACGTAASTGIVAATHGFIAAAAGIGAAAGTVTALTVALPVTGGILAGTTIGAFGVAQYHRNCKEKAETYIGRMFEHGGATSMAQVCKPEKCPNEAWGRALVAMRDKDRNFAAFCDSIQAAVVAGHWPQWANKIPEEKLRKLCRYKGEDLAGKVARYVHTYYR